MPKEQREVVERANFDLWNDLMAIIINNPKKEIKIVNIIKDLGRSYAVDLKISCINSAVQQQLDAVYERNILLSRFTKHEHFNAMIS